jgi:hypothetical protein
LSKECSCTIVKGSFSFSMNCIFTITNILMVNYSLMEFLKSVNIVTVFDNMFYNMFYSCNYIETLYFC